jgi:hypothetical protein
MLWSTRVKTVWGLVRRACAYTSASTNACTFTSAYTGNSACGSKALCSMQDAIVIAAFVANCRDGA